LTNRLLLETTALQPLGLEYFRND